MGEPNRQAVSGSTRLLDLLADPQRRAVLATLATASAPLTVEELARSIVPEDEQTAAIDLHHTHLPKLDEAGFVRYDQEAAMVELTTDTDRLAARIEQAAAPLHELVATTRSGEEG